MAKFFRLRGLVSWIRRWWWAMAIAGVIIIGLAIWWLLYQSTLVEVSGYRVPRPVAKAAELYTEGKTAEAKRIYQQQVNRHPQDWFSWNGLANIYREARAYADAEAAYQKALAVNRRFTQGYRNIYTLYALWAVDDPAKLSKAEAVLLDGLKYNPNSVTVLEDVVSYYRKIGNSASAEQYANILAPLKAAQ
jgi:Flp pilus assembly protein TadD